MKPQFTALIAVLVAAAAGTTATAQTRSNQQTQTRTNQPAQTAQQQQPQPQQQINSVPLLCRVREQELVALNRLVVDRNQALQREADANKRQVLAQQVQNFVNNMRETEASWSRMDCARIIYGAR